jgi:hypothetical protein
MNRRPSFFLRATRALVGLVTMWCLGCGAYEPIVELLARDRTMPVMTNDSVVRHAGETGSAIATASATIEIGPSSSIGPDDTGVDCCGGGSCHLVVIDYVAAVHTPLHALQHLHELPGELASVSRAPLNPPPQQTL